MDVTLLTRMEDVTAKGVQRKNAVLVGTHGLKIARGDKHGLLLPIVAIRHKLDAEGFLQQVCGKAGLPADAWQDDDVLLTTFHGHAIKGELNSLLDEHQSPTLQRGLEPVPSLAPGSPRSGSASIADIRMPAVAGRVLSRRCGHDRSYAGRVAPRTTTQRWSAARSRALGRGDGPARRLDLFRHLAAAVFSRVKFPSRVIILSAKHRREGADWAVAPYAAWQLPGRRLDSDPELARVLVESIAGLELDAAAHAQEHAIEVQLPFIARLAHAGPRCRYRRRAPCLHGRGELEDLQRFGRQMAAACVHGRAAAAGRIQRHEPLCRQPGDPSSRPSGPGGNRRARSRAALSNRA